MKVLELFSGIGAIRKALGEDNEYFPVELEKRVLDVYNTLYDTKHVPQDIREFKSVEYFDLVVAGFPCQPFSQAGKRLGFKDPRGDLFKETLRVIKDVKPKYVILENVSGILQDQHIWIVHEIVNELKKQGFIVRWELINSFGFRTKQIRRRVFIYGRMK